MRSISKPWNRRRTAVTRRASAAWDPRGDRALWAALAAALGLPLAARLLGASFWLGGGAQQAFRASDPLLWAGAPLLLALCLAARAHWALRVALALQILAGLLLMATLLQAPPAFVLAGEPGTGLEAVVAFDLALAYGAAFATGALYLGIGAYLVRRSLLAP